MRNTINVSIFVGSINVYASLSFNYMNIYPTIYIDEAGNTGSNILNCSQPYFILSAVHFTDIELLQLQKDIMYDRELHFVEMKKSIKGRNTIKLILQHPLINEEHISFEFIDKQFCIYAQIVDMTIEPVFHYIYGDDLYKKRGNIILANCLYVFCKNHPNQDIIKDFLYSFEGMMRKQTEESIENFYLNVEILASVSNKSLTDILQHISLSRNILEHVLIEDNKYCLDTTVTSLLCMVDHWFKKFGTKMNVVTDDSKQIKAGLNMIEQLSKITSKQQLVGYDTRKHIFPLPINSISMVDSNSNFGVQLADLIASSFSFVWSDATSKYIIFQNELKLLPFFNLKGYPIQPATTEYLSQEVDYSNDSSPIDYIIQNLQDKAHL